MFADFTSGISAAVAEWAQGCDKCHYGLQPADLKRPHLQFSTWEVDLAMVKLQRWRFCACKAGRKRHEHLERCRVKLALEGGDAKGSEAEARLERIMRALDDPGTIWT